MKPIKGHSYLLNYYKIEPIRCLRGTNMITEKENVCYKGVYEFIGHNYFFSNDLGKDISINNKLFNQILIKEIIL